MEVTYRVKCSIKSSCIYYCMTGWESEGPTTWAELEVIPQGSHAETLATIQALLFDLQYPFRPIAARELSAILVYRTLVSELLPSPLGTMNYSIDTYPCVCFSTMILFQAQLTLDWVNVHPPVPHSSARSGNQVNRGPQPY